MMALGLLPSAIRHIVGSIIVLRRLMDRARPLCTRKQAFLFWYAALQAGCEGAPAGSKPTRVPHSKPRNQITGTPVPDCHC